MQICICRVRVEYNFDEIVIHARTGLNPRKNFILGKGNNRYITIKNIKNNSLVIDDNTDFIDDEAVDMIHKRSQIKKVIYYLLLLEDSVIHISLKKNQQDGILMNQFLLLLLMRN